jgi:excinuclease ABC subunit C
MARHVPKGARRDLKPPAYLRLDPGERFPRVTVRGAASAGGRLPGLFGPFRNRRAAARAVAALHKLFPLRPCDFEFHPAPDLAVGLGCVYAQVRTCAAPCLTRVSEDAYRGLAAEAVHFLAGPHGRPEETRSWIPEWVSAADSRAVVIEEAHEGLEIYPIIAGAVLDDQVRTAQAKDIEGALEGMKWTGANETGHDRGWLAAWLYAPKRSGRYVVLDGDENSSALVQLETTPTPRVR